MKIGTVLGLTLMLCIMCGSDGFAQTEKIKLGVIGPMSGAGAAWGIVLQRGVGLAVEDINNAGGVKVGGKTYLFDYVSADDKYTGTVAVSEGARIIFENKVKYVFGPIGSSPAVAFSPLMNENKILVFIDSNAPEVISPQFPYNFRFIFSSHESAPVVWKYVKEKYHVNTVVTLGQNDATGTSHVATDTEACNKYGMKMLYHELFDLATKDFMPLITKVVAMKPDSIDIGACAPGYTAQMAKALNELGYKGIKVATLGSGEAETLVPIIGKEACEGFVATPNDFSADYATPWQKQFYARYVSRFGKPFGRMAGEVYWPVMWLKEAMEKTGSLDVDVIKQYLETPGRKLQDYYGLSQFGGKRHYGISHNFKEHVYVTEIRDGKNVLVQKPEIPDLELQ